jgi:type IV pilus assembly protein PilA
MKNSDDNNKKNFPLWVNFLIVFGIIGVLAAIALPSFFNQSAKVKATFMRMSIAGLMKTQSENYKKTGRFFAPNELSGDLSMSSTLDKDNSYELQISLKSNTVALVTATPKRDGLVSYTGINFRDSYWICQSLQPSRTPPQVDRTDFTAVECPVGSTVLE